MTKALRLLLASFLLSTAFWWSVNLLDSDLKFVFLWREMANNPQLLLAQTNQKMLDEKLKQLKPLPRPGIEDLVLEAKAGMVVAVKEDREKVLFEKNGESPLPIASLTKLMTALVVMENYPLSQEVQITQKAVEQGEDIGGFKVGERFFVKDLLYSLLIESSNDAAYALSEVIGEEPFVNLMNLTAKNLGLLNTYFINPTGLDPDEPTEPHNYSTGQDVVKLARYLLEEQSFIEEILRTGTFDLYQANGVLHHIISTTNKLMGTMPRLMGGKTGYADEARGCFIVVLKNPKNQGYLVNVILGAKDRFSQMQKLIDWAEKAYRW